MLVLEACLRGDFLDRKFGFGEQAAGADDAEFKQILVRTQTGVRGVRAMASSMASGFCVSVAGWACCAE